MNTYKRLLGYVVPYWWALLLVMLGFAINAAGEVYGAELIKQITNAINASDAEAMGWLPYKLVLLFALKGGGSFLGVYFSAVVAKNMVYQLRMQSFDKLLSLPNQHFLTESGGKLASKLIYDVEQVTAAGSDALRVFLREGLIVVGLLSFLIYTNWRLTLILLSLIPLIALVTFISSKLFRNYSTNVQQSMSDVSHIVNEVIGGIETVKNYGGVATEKKRFTKAADINLNQSLKEAATAAISVPVVQLMIAVAMAVVLLISLRPEILGQTSAGEFIGFITACILISKPVRQLTDVNQHLQRGLVAADSLFELIDAASETNKGTHTNRLTGEICLEDVCMSYGDNPALSNINLTIKAGETVAFVGRSGAGKTTLIGLLNRAHVHNSGTISYIDDQQQKVAIEDIQLASLRNQIASVSQNVVLFDASVKDNIAYGELAQYSFEKIQQATQNAQADGFINQLPDGYETHIGTNGLSLSGGQRQRIAIARALLKDAPILILDEATSALDNESEHFIQQALENAMQNRTTLVIAHRLSTIENADRIVVMDKGRIIEQGNHSELLAQDGVYASMHARNFQE